MNAETLGGVTPQVRVLSSPSALGGSQNLP